MSKYACLCGHVINLSQGWSTDELTLVPEAVIETVGDKLDEVKGLSSEQFYEIIGKQAVTVYRCPKCRRLHLEEGFNKFLIYAIE